MARKYKLLSACGSGIATSSHVAASIKSGMADRDVEVEVRTCGVTEISGLIDSIKPDAIFSTTPIDDIVSNLGDIKIFSGVPLLTGINKKKLLDDLASYLKSLG